MAIKMSSDVSDLAADPSDHDLAKGLKKKRFSGKQLILFVVLPVVLIAGGAAAFFMLSGSEPKETTADGTENAADATSNEPSVTLFYDLPEMLVNLNTGGRKASYLKIKIALEVDKQSTIAELDAKLPRVIDNFQVYLRELRLEDLNGSAGMFRLKEELLSRVNTSLYPTQVKDVLFKEMLVQ